VDDIEVPVESTKRGFIMVPITGGKHRVELRFGRTIPEIAGLFTSVAAAITISVILLGLYWRSAVFRFRARKPKKGKQDPDFFSDIPRQTKVN